MYIGMSGRSHYYVVVHVGQQQMALEVNHRGRKKLNYINESKVNISVNNCAS